MHINTCSLNKHFEDLEYLLKTANINFDVIAISETRIPRNSNIDKNINIANFCCEFTPTGWIAGGTLLYIPHNLAYQVISNNLNIYKKNYLKSTFTEITNPTKTNIIFSSIYRHSTTDLNEFNCYYLNPLLEKLAKERKTVFLLCEFNVDLLKYEQHKPTNGFLDSWQSNKLLPYIVQPTRIISFLIIFFSNYLSQEIT